MLKKYENIILFLLYLVDFLFVQLERYTPNFWRVLLKLLLLL